MDNITHSLVGLAAAKAGLERLSPGATALCVIAANAPDADIVAALGGRWFYLHHHRGITHSLVGTLALAFLIPLLFYAGDKIIALLRGRPPRALFGGLLIASLLVSATHPLMDWTNNYGLRPLLPWNGQWFYGDLVFIVDPWLWLTVGGAAFLLTARTKWKIAAWATLALILTLAIFFGPIRDTGLLNPTLFRAVWLAVLTGLIFAHRARVRERWGNRIAHAAFALVLIYWGGLGIAHQRALAKAQTFAETVARAEGDHVNRLAAMPVFADPTRWRCVVDTDRTVYRFDLSLGEMETANLVRFDKPTGEPAQLAARASQDERARIFLEFARFPVERVEGDCLSQILVQFADLRYTDPPGSPRGSFSLQVPVECQPSVVESNTK